jgi:hypothetical protein
VAAGHVIIEDVACTGAPYTECGVEGSAGLTAMPGEVWCLTGGAGGVARRGHPRAGYFFGKVPVLLVPPQKTLVPTRSFRP